MNKSFLALSVLKRINKFIRIGMILAEILIYLSEWKLQHSVLESPKHHFNV